VEHLNEHHYPTVGIEGRMSLEERRKAADEFVNDPQDAAADDKVRIKALVCTDLMARGIDMKRIRNVILYDLPYSSSDLLHRIGRTGRLNSRGRCLLFVSKKESQGWVRGLQKVIKSGLAIA
jgi:ATP-dependent RNA helicase MRH4